MSRRSVSQTANSNERRREREHAFLLCALSLSLSLSLTCSKLMLLLLLLSSLTLVASRNKYHKWNREYHESVQDEKRLSLSMLMEKNANITRMSFGEANREQWNIVESIDMFGLCAHRHYYHHF
jgi:hypothetical protein